MSVFLDVESYALDKGVCINEWFITSAYSL